MYTGDVYYEYTELISKNNQHRFKDINTKNKCVLVSGSEKCVVRLLDFYFSKFPENPPAFYLRALDKVPVDSKKGRGKRRGGGVSWREERKGGVCV